MAGKMSKTYEEPRASGAPSPRSYHHHHLASKAGLAIIGQFKGFICQHALSHVLLQLPCLKTWLKPCGPNSACWQLHPIVADERVCFSFYLLNIEKCTSMADSRRFHVGFHYVCCCNMLLLILQPFKQLYVYSWQSHLVFLLLGRLLTNSVLALFD